MTLNFFIISLCIVFAEFQLAEAWIRGALSIDIRFYGNPPIVVARKAVGSIPEVF